MTAASAIGPGTVLAGKYRVDGVLGEGGMGLVVAATHVDLDRRVAIKLLRPEVAANADLVERFGREARSASRIQGAHVAKVLDVGRLPGGEPFMVMEHLQGSDLGELVKRRGGLPGQDAVEYLLQACEALAEAHALGIVHRDVKPANLFLTTAPDGSPCVKVLDFGISKVAIETERGLTQTSTLMGSPQYMSPEQVRSARDVDHRTDIWSLGVVLHELLTGDVAFRADTVPELYVAILQQPPEPLRVRRPDAPPGVEAAILRCLEKDPARRFANVAELAMALRSFAPPRALPSVDRIARIVGGSGLFAQPQLPAPSDPRASAPHGAHVSTYAAPGAQRSLHPPGMHGGPAGLPVHVDSPKRGMPTALVVLLLIAGAVAIGFVGCVLMIVGAGTGNRH